MEQIISVGINNKGEIDFSVSAKITELDFVAMQEFRAMIIAAIGTAEIMWRRSEEVKHQKQSSNAE